jgi:hypothetical protein
LIWNLDNRKRYGKDDTSYRDWLITEPGPSICKGHPGRKAGPQSRESNVHMHHDRPTAMTLRRLSFFIFRSIYILRTLFRTLFLLDLEQAVSTAF